MANAPLLPSRWSWFVVLVVLTTIAGASLAYTVSARLTRVYEVNGTVLVPSSSQAGLIGLPVASYAELLKSPGVVNEALSAAGWPAADGGAAIPSIDTVPRRDAQLVQLTVRSIDPSLAARLVPLLVSTAAEHGEASQANQTNARRAQLNALLDERTARVANTIQRLNALQARPPESVAAYELSRAQADVTQAQQSAAAAQRSVNDLDVAWASRTDLRLVEPVVVPAQPAQPRTLLNVLLGAILGLGCGVAVAMVVCTDELARPSTLRGRSGLSVVGEVAYAPMQPRPVHALAAGPFSEGVLAIRAVVQSRLSGQSPTIMLVTSPAEGDGKTSVAGALGVSLAAAGEKVVLVDGNLQHPNLHTLLGVEANGGLATLLTDGTLVARDSLVTTNVLGLSFLPAGPPRPQSADLVASPVLLQHLMALAEGTDVLLIDGPSLDTSESMSLAAAAHAVLVVVDARCAHVSQLRQAAARLEQLPVEVLGVVFNHPTAPRSRLLLTARKSGPLTSSPLAINPSRADGSGGTRA